MLDVEPRDLVADVERLLEDVEALPDPVARDKATAVVQALLELYGAGLEQIVELVSASDDAAELAHSFAEDELVSHLLLLHGLHPVKLEDRVLSALEEVRPYMESHGGDVELVGIEGGVVQLRLAGSCSGCPSSAMTLKLAVENAIRKTAPEIDEVRAEEAAPAAQGTSPLLQLEVTPAAMGGEWTMAGGLPELGSGGLVVKAVGGTPLAFLKLGARAYAYRARCPACGSSLAGAALQAAELTCSECGNRYDALRAGRGLDAPQLHLEPVPLLEDEDGLVRVALPVTA
jgi:Fe-S cluster biogenesis protein NfuA/nitrite reductase/ring-hydroxylating ferredoxin subunit